MAKPYGYIGKILRVDLSSGSITQMPTMDYADRFLGGGALLLKSAGMKCRLRSVLLIPRTD